MGTPIKGQSFDLVVQTGKKFKKTVKRKVTFWFVFDERGYSYNRFMFDFEVFKAFLLNKKIKGPEFINALRKKILNYFLKKKNKSSPDIEKMCDDEIEKILLLKETDEGFLDILTQLGVSKGVYKRMQQINEQIYETYKTDINSDNAPQNAPRFLENINVPHNIIASKNCPPISEFRRLSMSLLTPIFKYVFLNIMPELIYQEEANEEEIISNLDIVLEECNIYIKIGDCKWGGEENIAIIDEEAAMRELEAKGISVATKSSDFNNIYVGFHGSFISRYAVLPYYFSSRKVFEQFIIKCILHELQHFKQIGRTQHEFAILKKMGKLKYMRGTCRIFYYTIFELMKELEAHLAELRYTEKRAIDMNWVYTFKGALAELVRQKGNYKELLENYYPDAIDTKFGIMFNSMIMGFTISFHEAKKDRHPELIPLYFSSGTGMELFHLDKLDEIMKEKKSFYIGKVPDVYINKVFALTSNMTNIAKFVKLYDDACIGLGIEESNRIISFNEYKRLWEWARKTDKEYQDSKNRALLT